ncbi:TetR/AcrR family transcriptional regulator [Virgisporangium aurantiacum]|uniref:TetR family transcriptional regulator n=1 Tax=Virgisporangium aurantiacum TaxID=175570 RepID=A0A8J4E3Q4_9ACTN|nr:TetR family transcriptional regulator [Virgisporangium aurantiacum]GIJ60193.1 TetR family transcriptional regulator [Virgisporangium aurantiacum]
MTGLRERKRQRTHDTVSTIAVAMFLEHGYDRVSVADIAAAADISKPTLFRYFRSKEDLVLHRFADHTGEAARVVRARPPERSPLGALLTHVLDGLSRRDPVTGLNDHPEVLRFHDLVFSTPALSARVNDHVAGEVAELAAALSPAAELTARLAAAQIVAVQHLLARENWRCLSDGETADARHPAAVADAEHAFDLLAGGLRAYA